MKTKSEEQVMKKCSKCDVVKPLGEFFKDKSKEDRLRPSCKECSKTWHQQHYQKHKEKYKQSDKQYYQNNKEKKKQYAQEHKEERKEYLRQYRMKQSNNDPMHRLRNNVRRQVQHALKRNNSSKHGESVMKYLPYNVEQLKGHIEKKFELWMNWNNYGEWHIDHIYPQSKLPYDSMSHPNFQKCWALENLQPLEASENMSKGNKIINE